MLRESHCLLGKPASQAFFAHGEGGLMSHPMASLIVLVICMTLRAVDLDRLEFR